MEERYLTYSAACPPRAAVCQLAPFRRREDKAPSELVGALLSIFPSLLPLRGLPGEYFANSKEAAFSRLAARFSAGDGEAGALRLFLRGTLPMPDRCRPWRGASGPAAGPAGGQSAGPTAFWGKLFLSPTQVETYHQCRFQYFCRYGLNAKERRRAEVDVLQYGTLMHYLSRESSGFQREERQQWTEEEL